MKKPSANRAALLGLFFANPDRSYYMHEIGRILGKKPGNFQKTINNMESEGVLQSEYMANARYFRVNKAYPLYDELKSMVFKTVGIAGALRDALVKLGDVDLAFIYGSYARAAEHPLSDIDLVVIGDTDEDGLIAELDRMERRLGREVNFKLYTVRQFRRSVGRKDAFLLEILRDSKIMVMGDEDGLRKVLEGKPGQAAKA